MGEFFKDQKMDEEAMLCLLTNVEGMMARVSPPGRHHRDGDHLDAYCDLTFDKEQVIGRPLEFLEQSDCFEEENDMTRHWLDQMVNISSVGMGCCLFCFILCVLCCCP